ncbi:IPT/TIG domain-containing protein [Hymenobacter sp. M29]|uniref:IPT/TIG domain-containing protein n=1 Tax=Hymenobacter mellowenesis TaxID=3063995 RepID=A0ABT9ACQ4_9BACT|nr:IPT/TIG domain-containing protein [Hymenobacter sp. M29]MDO7847631.1 IPT/TIG domain-containing protein [Hymenobacter sp. M29]
MPTPVITSIFPPYGPVLTPVTLTGTDLDQCVGADAGGFGVIFTLVNPTTITLTIPANYVSGGIVLYASSGPQPAFPFTLADVAPLPEQVGFTLSWQQDFQSWTGEHTHTPTAYLGRGKDLYRVQEDYLQKQSRTSYQQPDQELTLEVVANAQPLQEKAFDTLILDQQAQSPTVGLTKLPYIGFNRVSARTDFQATGDLDVVYPASYADKWAVYGDNTRVVADYKKAQHHLELPGSATVDLEQALDLPANLDQARTFKPRLNGKYCWVTLTWDLDTSPSDLKLVLNTLRLTHRAIPR